MYTYSTAKCETKKGHKAKSKITQILLYLYGITQSTKYKEEIL